MKCVFHAGADDVVAAEDEGVEDEDAGDDASDESGNVEEIFGHRMALEEGRFHVHWSILA